MSGRYAQTMYGNKDVKFFVSMFDNFVGRTGYSGLFANDPSVIMYQTPPSLSTANNTRFGYRQPIRRDGVTPYWFLQNTGNTTLEQEIVTEQIDMLAAAGVYGVELVYYPQPEHVTSSPTATPPRDPWSQCLWQWAKYYFTSPSKSKLKFVVLATSLNSSYDASTGNADQEFTSAGTFLNLPNFATYWATLMQDAQYAKDANGLPFFNLLDGVATWLPAHLTTITAAAVTAGFSGVHYAYKPNSDTAASTLGADNSGYNNGIGSGTQLSYQAQINQDRSFWAHGANLLDKQLAIAHMNDGRVARGPGSWWTDGATYSKWEYHLKQTFAFARASRKVRDQVVSMYSGGEIAEAGEFFPTLQTILRGVNTPSMGPYLDAIKNVVYGTYPSTYVDCYHAMDVHADITRVGGANWTTANSLHNGGGSAIGAYKFQEHRNTTVGNTISITPALNCTRIRVYGRKGVGFGTFNAQTDGGGATLVDQSAISETYNTLLYDTGTLSAASHTVLLTVVTGISIDEFKVNISR